MQFGIARTEITPPFPMPMAGFGFRMDAFDTVHDPLTFTAVYLNDGREEAWIGAADLCQFPDGAVRDEALEALAARLGASPERLFLNASHTHGGPEVLTTFGFDRLDFRVTRTGANGDKIRRYQDFLWDRIGAALAEARRRAEPGSLHLAEGRTDFVMNRRRLVNGRIENAPNPGGVVDDRLRLLGIKNIRGGLKAILPILACHPSSTGAQHRLTGDYVAAWRKRVEAEWPGVTMAFLQGCGGDLRPACTEDGDRWRRAGLEELPSMGAHLLRETRAALEAGWRDLGPLKIHNGIEKAAALCERTFFDPRALAPLLRDDRWWAVDFAREISRRLEAGEDVPDRVPFRFHWLRLTDQCSLLGLDCEPVCRLGFAVERAFARHGAIALGYVNGCFGYVPTGAELAEGGYECESYLWEPWSGPFQQGIEDWVVEHFRSLLGRRSL